ncbi:MAG: class I SAM-dependent methyltransferase [Xenococcus sp. MO_188.B8]|nr:class I SAM-dependent methyltransferase [Xenococcus sp. MO_188.B8]
MPEFIIRVENSAPSQSKPAKSVLWASEVLQELGITNIADLGCGRLRNLIVFQNYFSEITLIDTDLQCNRVQYLIPEAENVKLITSSIFQEEEKLYEAIFLISVLHILPEPKMRNNLLNLAISKLAKPGFLVVDVPTGVSYYRKKCTNDRKCSDGYVMGNGRYRTFYKNFYAKELDTLLSINGHLKLYKKVYFDKHLVRIMTNQIYKNNNKF